MNWVEIALIILVILNIVVLLISWDHLDYLSRHLEMDIMTLMDNFKKHAEDITKKIEDKENK